MSTVNLDIEVHITAGLQQNYNLSITIIFYDLHFNISSWMQIKYYEYYTTYLSVISGMIKCCPALWSKKRKKESAYNVYEEVTTVY